ncbi:MAG: BTAD domain-containing putative transcriptional regulator [Candidatus Nanopelagicales bacterium]
MWRGRPFGDLEDWVPARSETTRLEEMHRTAQEDLLEARPATGEHRQVAVEAEAAVRLEPLRERRWAILATAQYRGGRQGDALRSLRTARRTLRDRLGVDPGRDLVELESAILRHDPDLLEVPAVGPAAQACPYQGLAPYDVDDAEGFFGRDTDVTTCLERLAGTPLLVVAGASGSGKSSLARAGIVPALAAAGRRAVVLVPGEDPAGALAEAVGSSSDSVVLVIDQFEEVFTLERSDSAARAFCLQVADHARGRAPVVIVVRSDHLGALAVTPELGRLVEQGLFLVPPLAGDSLRMAIEAPALIGGLRLEPGLTDLLVRDCEGEPGSLPLLSHALAETWRRRDGNVLTVEAYRSAGGIRGAVARTADRLYDSLPDDDRALVRSVLLRLVVAPAQGAPFRRRIPMRGLLADPRRARVVTLLVRSRLVTIDQDTVEVAHEALARAWPRLRTWLEEDVAGQQVLGHLATAADGWDSLGRPDSELYRGARLNAALECRAQTEPDLTDVEDAFLAASVVQEQSVARELERRAVRDARANRRLRDLLAAACVLLAVALLAGGLADRGQYNAARQRDAAVAARESAQIEALVNRSRAARPASLSVAALLAVEAYRRQPDAGSRSALLSIFTATPTFLGYRYLPGQYLRGALVGGSPTAVVAPDGGDLAVLDLDSGDLDYRFPRGAGDTRGTVLQVSADGRSVARLSWTGPDDGCYDTQVAATTTCGTFAVYDVATGRERLAPVPAPFPPSGIALNADGSLVAVAGGPDGQVAWYRTRDGEPMGELPGSDGGVGERGKAIRFDGRYDTAAVTFGPDGTLFASSITGPMKAVNPAEPREVRSVDVPPLFAETHLIATPDGVLIGGGSNGLVAVDTATMTRLWALDTRGGRHPETCPWVAVSPPAGRLYCGSYYGVIQERDLATGRPTGATLDAQLGSIGDLAVTADSRELVAFGAEAPTVSRWRLDGSGLITDVIARGHVVFEGYDNTGQTLLVASRPPNATIYSDFDEFTVWNPTTDRGRVAITDVEGLGWAGPAALLGYATSRDRMEFYSPATGKTLPGLQIPTTVQAIWPSAGGTRAYAGFPDGQIWTLDAATRQPIGPTLQTGGFPLAISATAGGERVVVSSNGPTGLQTAVLDGNTGDPLVTKPLQAAVTSVSQTGEMVGALGGQITGYDLDTLEPVSTFAAARGEINSLQFSTDATTLLATSNDQTVSVYDVASGTQLGDPIPAVAPFIVAGSLRPDGLALAVTGQDGVTIWNLDSVNLLVAACRLAGRNLTQIEWATHLGDLGPYRATCPAEPR